VRVRRASAVSKSRSGPSHRVRGCHHPEFGCRPRVSCAPCSTRASCGRSTAWPACAVAASREPTRLPGASRTTLAAVAASAARSRLRRHRDRRQVTLEVPKSRFLFFPSSGKRKRFFFDL
jgi:hypothetical protein